MNMYAVGPFCADTGSFAKIIPGDRLREDGKVCGVVQKIVIKPMSGGRMTIFWTVTTR